MNHAIILAAGSGNRFESETPKHLFKFCGSTVLEHTLKIFNESKQIDSITIVARERDILLTEEITTGKFNKVCKIISGGADRLESAFLGLMSLNCSSEDNVLIHDAARPLVTSQIINNCIEKLTKCRAVDTIVDCQDTIVEIKNDEVFGFPQRKLMKKGQTPQGFKYDLIFDCHQKSRNLDEKTYQSITDDCGLVKIFYPKEKISYIKGDESNIKITYPQDIFLADKLMQIRIDKCSNCIDKKFLTNKSILIFGGSQGIGLEIAKLADSLGMRVQSFSRKHNQTDVGNEKDIDKALKYAKESFKKIDFIINTAGLLFKKPLDQLSQEEIHSQINTNFLGCVNIAKLAPVYMKKGKILFFTSSSYTMGRATYSIYSATKSAVVNFTQAIAEEFKDIKVNCICPSRTNTQMRLTNFGKEPIESLLCPKKVAETSLSVLCSEFTGRVIKI